MKNLIFYPYDFFFDLINYKTKDLVNKSKKIRNIPKFIRNTLFLNDDTIKRVRKMNFNQSFIIGEQLKESTEKIYKEGNYYEALQQYNLIYSLFRWLEFKDKTKEETLMKDVTKISDMPIIDDDVILKRCAVNDPERRRKTNIVNEIKNNGTIDDSISIIVMKMKIKMIIMIKIKMKMKKKAILVTIRKIKMLMMMMKKALKEKRRRMMKKKKMKKVKMKIMGKKRRKIIKEKKKK
jgi:hypothetical protein